MSTSWRPIAVLDANVLYPAPLRDLLIRLAIDGQYQAKWSARILDACFASLPVRGDVHVLATALHADATVIGHYELGTDARYDQLRVAAAFDELATTI